MSEYSISSATRTNTLFTNSHPASNIHGSLQHNHNEQTSTYGRTVQLVDYIEGISSSAFAMLNVVMIVICVIHLAHHNNNKLYYALWISISVYESLTIVLCTYYICRFKWVHIKSIIQFSKFWIQSICSSIFNLIAGLLLIINLFPLQNDTSKHWHFANVAVYLLSSISIPFPSICIKLHHKYKKEESNREARYTSSYMYSPSTTCTISDDDAIISASASCAAGKPIFSNNILKGGLCACYFAHFLGFILIPLHSDTFDQLMQIMYGDHKILYVINQVFFRMFVGINLISVFFTFVTELTDKKIITSNYYILFPLCLQDQHCVSRSIWIVIVVFLVLCTPFEAFKFRTWIDGMRIHPKVLIWAKDSKDIDTFINLIWILINSIGSLIALIFLITFQGIYRTTKRHYSQFYCSSQASSIKSFVLEAVIFFGLSLIYISFMYIDMVQQKFICEIKWDIYRQCAILIFLCFQFTTLIRIKQIQKFGRIYLKHFKKRRNFLLHGYYKFMSLLLLYNLYYVFAFSVQYFNSFKDKHKMVGYTLSFALPGTMLLMLSVFLNSYGQWKLDQKQDEDWKKNHTEPRYEDESMPPRYSNSALNEHLHNRICSKNTITPSSPVHLYEE
eukprot:397194_1